jgi:hypothetical protein
MAIDDVLLTLTTVPVPTELQTIENVVRLAGKLRAIVFHLHCSEIVSTPPALPAAIQRKAAPNARDLLSVFETIADHIQHEKILIRCRPIDIPRLSVPGCAGGHQA